MKSYSSTSINLFVKHCPAALGMREAGEPEYREIYQTGVAAHAVLQVVGEKNARTPAEQQAVAKAVTQELIEHGRAFKGVPEPPMDPESAFNGRDLALRWLADNELPGAGSHELWLGMGADGTNTDPKLARYDAIIDLVYPESAGDEDWHAETVVVRDYKTSWVAGEDELWTLQRKGQAVLAWLKWPHAGGITREVVNLRTGAVYRDTTWLDDDGLALLEGWRDDILALCTAADSTRAARPGVGCIGCPFVLRCTDCVGLLGTRERPAEAWAAAQAVLKFTAPLLKQQAKESGPVPDGAGGLVGFREKQKRRLNGDALEHIKALELDQGALLQALKPGVGNVSNLARAIYDKTRMPEREDFLAACLEEFTAAEFGGWQEIE
jgi:hypothetical protein